MLGTVLSAFPDFPIQDIYPLLRDGSLYIWCPLDSKAHTPTQIVLIAHSRRRLVSSLRPTLQSFLTLPCLRCLALPLGALALSSFLHGQVPRTGNSKAVPFWGRGMITGMGGFVVELQISGRGEYFKPPLSLLWEVTPIESVAMRIKVVEVVEPETSSFHVTVSYWPTGPLPA